MMYKAFTAVFLGGGLGASLRLLLSWFMLRLIGKPWAGTLLVNILGCTCLFLLAQTLGRNNETLNYFLRVGLFGGLTTFSTFAFETVTLIQSERYIEAGLVVFLNVFFGIVIGIFILHHKLL